MIKCGFRICSFLLLRSSQVFYMFVLGLSHIADEMEDVLLTGHGTTAEEPLSTVPNPQMLM